MTDWEKIKENRSADEEAIALLFQQVSNYTLSKHGLSKKKILRRLTSKEDQTAVYYSFMEIRLLFPEMSSTETAQRLGVGYKKFCKTISIKNAKQIKSYEKSNPVSNPAPNTCVRTNL